MLENLCWSLLGVADLDPLSSVDEPSVYLAHFLYALFLILGAILLVNMMIALLSNTYQQVEVNLIIFLLIKYRFVIRKHKSRKRKYH